MKNPMRNDSDIVEYKSTKRKKSTDTAAVYSTRHIPWEEQLQLPERFHESGEGTWPALAILQEKIGKNKRKQFLVEWEPHPVTGEKFEPTWQSQVGNDLLKHWNRKQGLQIGDSEEASKNGSDGHSVKPEIRRAKAIRRIPDSSSETGSQQKSIRSTRRPSTPGRRNHSSTETSSRRSQDQPGPSASSPVEIAETQEEVSQPVLPVSISVEIPPTSIDKAEYQSLHSSQINSDGGFKGLYSPYPDRSLTRSSPKLDLSQASRDRDYAAPPSSSSGRQGLRDRHIILSTSVETPGSTDRQQHSITNDRSGTSARRLVHTQSGARAEEEQEPQQPLTRHIPSSATSSRSSAFVTPQYVPSTHQETLLTRDPSKELGSYPLRISSLLTNEKADTNSPTPNTQRQNRNGTGSSPWAFQTQAPPESGPVDFTLVPDTGTPKWGKRLLEAFSSPERSKKSRSRQMASSPGPPMESIHSFTAPQPDEGMTSGHKEAPFGQFSSSNDIGTSAITTVTTPRTANHDENASDAASVPSHPRHVPVFDAAMAGSALPIQNSIEEDNPTSSGEQSSAESKPNSSQQSVENERDIPQVGGLVLPSYPILGPAEYALALPAEGKIQSTYSDIIKAKRKAILNFVNRHESVGSSNGSPNRTHERNEMNEMIQLLNDTVTHMDLGLPGFSTQYSIQSEEHAAYANYAGSKFSLLGHLVDILKPVECSIVIMSRAGTIQDLIEHYLTMKHIDVRRMDHVAASRSPIPDRQPRDFQVDLVSTFSTHQVVFPRRPILMIAFDASYDSQDPQVMRIRQYFSPKPPSLLPVIHLLVSNSSEHVDRCLPKDMPSPSRLKVLVRATYQARPNLGGKPTYVPDDSDEPEGRPMDFSDLQRALRKSPERKLARLAAVIARASVSQDFDTYWSLGMMPELQLTEMDNLPSRLSGVSPVAQVKKEPVARSRTPNSRAGTPSGKKRLLEIDNVLPALNKRQRLTPLRDSVEASNINHDTSSQIETLQGMVSKLQSELHTEREARQKAEEDRSQLQEQLDKWRKDHADLQRRYEKRMTKCHVLEGSNKKLLKTIENNKTRQDRAADDHGTMKRRVTELQAELTTVREEVKAGGGDAAALETAREEARGLRAKNNYLDKSLENTRKDFEFTRSQYQDASNKAADFATQARELEEQVAELTKSAGDEKRRLKEKNYEESMKRHLAKISEIEMELKTRDTLLRKLEEENRQLKRSRGVQTRGSSVQPPGSPGLDAPGRGTRSRQGSPAAGLFPTTHHGSATNRGSLLRHER
ncbi:class II histone deacetylase complex subunits 2 and 3-domain-containing protein [Exophiala viscosa]|uniref:Class II histone deacetylase complex subunits 2 and 3-domain-containing protein n=1 Tax=Exophiala viscosa TaxID=2486360 RepID=A0AAN6IHU8_9EURO|nr:class II histone deacetylase complex subunits 2 and 3-domain-containing protein [Exophiala viscosa]